MEKIRSFDLRMFRFVNHFPHPKLFVNSFRFFSFLGDIGMIWIILAILLAFFDGENGFFAAILIIIALLVNLLANEAIIKLIFRRRRPYNNPSLEGLEFWGTRKKTFSFVSGHAFSSFAASTVIALLYNNLAIPVILLAALISFSRVYLGSHWVLDVVFGAILGILSGMLIISVSKNLFLL